MRTGQIETPTAAADFLRPFRDALREPILGAFGDWDATLRRSPEETGSLSPTCQARFIHDRTVARIIAAEVRGELPHGMRLRKVSGLCVVILRDTMFLKLKQLDRRLRSSNIRTRQTVRFDYQRPLLRGAGVVTNATSGYVRDGDTKELSRLVVVCWNGPDRLWTVDLSEAGTTGATTIELPAAPAPPARRRVAAKKARAGSVAEMER